MILMRTNKTARYERGSILSVCVGESRALWALNSTNTSESFEIGNPNKDEENEIWKEK